jgi:hypothetical protein
VGDALLHNEFYLLHNELILDMASVPYGLIMLCYVGDALLHNEYKVKSKVEIKGENVRLISHPIGPNGSTRTPLAP